VILGFSHEFTNLQKTIKTEIIMHTHASQACLHSTWPESIRMSTPKFSAAICQDLVTSLSDAYFSFNHERAVEWLKKAYYINGNQYSLNELIESMIQADPNIEKQLFGIFQDVLLQAIVNDNPYQDGALDTLWHYLDGDYTTIDVARSKLLEQCSSSTEINHETANSRHLALLYLLIHDNVNTEINYLGRIAQHIHTHGITDEVKMCLQFMEKFNPHRLSEVGLAYNAVCLESGKFPDMIDKESTVIKHLFRNRTDRMRHGLAAINIATTGIYEILNLSWKFDTTHTEELFKEISSKLEYGFSLVNVGVDEELKEELERTLAIMINILMAKNVFTDEDNRFYDIASDLLQKLKQSTIQSGASFKKILRKSFTTKQNEAEISGLNYYQASGYSLINSKNSPAKKLLAIQELNELSSEEIIEHFKSMPDVLGLLYKLNGSEKLIRHMDNKNKHLSIAHDLEL
jgi:hypothetical protein